MLTGLLTTKSPEIDLKSVQLIFYAESVKKVTHDEGFLKTLQSKPSFRYSN